ncbi:MAG: sigma-70 family RNA polymerase sigma factor [Acidobacteriia bacterium]|nr:sigma-70 family RNA polymerase sigma factor [Terriglobia bacterium]
MDAEGTYRERYLALLEEHTAALRRLCHSYCETRAEAEDLFQEIALALWTALARFRGESSDRTWLYRIAHNVALTFVTKRRKQVEREQPVDNEMNVPGAGSDMESQLAEAQKQQMLQLLVRKLPFEDRRLVLLYLEGLSTAEIEAVTGLTRSNVTVRLSRIRQRLSDRLQTAKARTVRS